MKSRIIVVDDDPSILELLRFLLEGEGYHVQAFDSAADALQVAIARPPDAAIVDLMMPGMNGLELVQALRYDARTQQVPVLLCSAYYGDLRHITTNLKLKEVSSLRKPFQIQDVLDKIAQMTSDSRRKFGVDATRVEQDTVAEENAAPAELIAAASQVQSSPAPSPVPIASLRQSRNNSARAHRSPREAPGIAAGQPRGRRG